MPALAEEFLTHPDNATMPEWIDNPYPPYEAKGTFDPFESFVKVHAYEAMESARRLKSEKKTTTPLETVDVRDLKLIGIAEKANGSFLGMVELPDGKGFLLHTGMTVGLYNGVVTAIGNGMLVVEEETENVFGEKSKQAIKLQLRKAKE